MKTIVIKSLSLLNFKGIKDLKVEFGDLSTDILGTNGTGKSTLFDAFTWLLFGKDSSDRKDFEIKTLDAENNVIPKIDHEVSAEIEIDGEAVTLRRAFKEKWVKSKGSEQAEFTGNETAYFWNDVPMQQREYQAKVSSIVDELVFKLITSPFAFDNLKWQDRRTVLTQIAGAETDFDLINRLEMLPQASQDVALLRSILNANKTIEDEKRRLAEKVKLLKKSLSEYPTRIAEVQHNTPEAKDFEALKSQLAEAEKELAMIDQELTDKSASFNKVYEQRRSEQSAIDRIMQEIGSIETYASIEAKKRSAEDNSETDSISGQIKAKESELKIAENRLSTLESDFKSKNESVESLERRTKMKREEWERENARVFEIDESDKCCPTCKRDFDESDINSKTEQFKANFNAEKAKKLNSISSDGKSLKHMAETMSVERREIEKQINEQKSVKANISAAIQKLREELAEKTNESAPKPSFQEIYESILSTNADYAAKKSEAEKLRSEMTPEPALENEGLQSRKQETARKIDSLKSEISVEAQIAKSNERINELMAEESGLAQEIASVEKQQFAIDSFIKFKTDSIESKVNKLFGFVKVKMFKTNINGGEEECCDILINGVPFKDANNAARINAGIDVINTLCRHYEVNAPVFIDNRESVCKLIDCNSQLINLIVSENDKSLRVKTSRKEIGTAA